MLVAQPFTPVFDGADAILTQAEHDEILAGERAKAATAARKADDEKTALTADRDKWRDHFHRATVDRDVRDAAVAEGAYNPDQIATVFAGKTRVVQLPGGGFQTRVGLPSTSTETGKPIVLDLEAREAVRALKSDPKSANLFTGAPKQPGRKLDTESYMQERRNRGKK